MINAGKCKQKVKTRLYYFWKKTPTTINSTSSTHAMNTLVPTSLCNVPWLVLGFGRPIQEPITTQYSTGVLAFFQPSVIYSREKLINRIFSGEPRCFKSPLFTSWSDRSFTFLLLLRLSAVWETDPGSVQIHLSAAFEALFLLACWMWVSPFSLGPDQRRTSITTDYTGTLPSHLLFKQTAGFQSAKNLTTGSNAQLHKRLVSRSRRTARLRCTLISSLRLWFWSTPGLSACPWSITKHVHCSKITSKWPRIRLGSNPGHCLLEGLKSHAPKCATISSSHLSGTFVLLTWIPSLTVMTNGSASNHEGDGSLPHRSVNKDMINSRRQSWGVNNESDIDWQQWCPIIMMHGLNFTPFLKFLLHKKASHPEKHDWCAINWTGTWGKTQDVQTSFCSFAFYLKQNTTVALENVY